MSLPDPLQQSLSLEAEDPLVRGLLDRLGREVDPGLARRVAEAAVAASRTPGASEESVSEAVIGAVGDAFAHAQAVIDKAQAELAGGS